MRSSYNLLAAARGQVQLASTARVVTTSRANVIADTPGGRTDRVVVVGAHLDSVTEGPGINDNGCGSATILEIAKQMAELGIAARTRCGSRSGAARSSVCSAPSTT